MCIDIILVLINTEYYQVWCNWFTVSKRVYPFCSGEFSYELWLRNDLYTNKHTQWFYFQIKNTRKGESELHSKSFLEIFKYEFLKVYFRFPLSIFCYLFFNLSLYYLIFFKCTLFFFSISQYLDSVKIELLVFIVKQSV